jgi:Lipase (class 3)
MDWNKAIAYGQLVNAAYDDFAGKPPARPGYNVVERIYANDLATDASRQRGAPVAIVAMGLILQAQASGDVVIAIRGTEGIKEWVQDAKFLKTPFTRAAGAGETEDGFTDVYDSMKVGQDAGAATIVKWLGEHQWKQPATSLTICGHSLGGAIATLLALDVAANAEAAFQHPMVYTYASPRTGDDQFVAKYNQLVETTNRLVDNADLVPKLPSDPPYKHVCDGIEMDSYTLIPPRIRLQPNPVCWHIMSSYLYLMSLELGGPPIGPEAECAPGEIAHGLLEQLKEKLRSTDKLADEFTAHPRRKMGGN